MSVTLIAWSALPNLHPAVVHFPLALLAVAFGFDTACVLLRRQRWLDSATAALYLLGALGAGAAFLTGRQAEDSLSGVSPAVQPLIAAHADMARLALITFSVVAGARAAIAWKERHRSEIFPRVIRLSLVLASAAALGILAVTADRGGALVYRHGLAVAAASPATPRRAGPADALQDGLSGSAELSGQAGSPDARTGTPEGRLTRGEHGALVWTPLPGDFGALGTVLKPAPGAAEGEVVAEVPQPTDREGLALKVSGRTVLLLPGAFEDVQVDAQIDLTRFRGRAGVVHHASEPGKAGAFVIDAAAGEGALLILSEGEPPVIDRGRTIPPRAPVTLSVSAVGSHIKGMVGGTVVAHAHHRSEGPGGAGLFLDGTGVVRVLQVRVTPLSGH